MGAQVMSLTPDIAAAYGLPGPWESIIVKVPDGTAAAQAKLRARDIITSLDASDMKDSRALLPDIVESSPGTTVTLGVWRDGKAIQVPVTLTDAPDKAGYGTFLGGAGVAKRSSSGGTRKLRPSDGAGH
jgi:serine protease Do